MNDDSIIIITFYNNKIIMIQLDFHVLYELQKNGIPNCNSA